MRRRQLWVLIVCVLLMGAAGVAWAQTADSSAASGGNADAAYGIETIIKLLSMGLGSWLFAQWNKNRPKLDALPNFLKNIAVTAIVTGLGLVGTFLHLTVSKETADWGAAFWTSLAGGVGTWVIGHIAIKSKKVQPTTKIA